MIASEATPFAKTGGLADVVGSLPAALAGFGDEAAVVLPRYGSIDLRACRRVWDNLMVHFGPAMYQTTIYQAPAPYPVYLVDCPALFDRKGLYGDNGIDYPDNHIRFAVFARAALGVARHLFRTEIFHCHDWQAGLVPVYLRNVFSSDPTFLGCRTLFTIHNIGYQGLFLKASLTDIGLDAPVFRPDGMEFYGQVSYIKGGIAFADALSTVSPTYAREIQTTEYGFGLDGILRIRSADLTGILNGVDYQEWNPELDENLPARYSPEDLTGKAICKRELLAEFGLPREAMSRPLFGIVSRFTRQKGTDLIAEIAADLVNRDTYLVALGTGEREYEEFFLRMQEEFPGRIAAKIGFDNGMAHRIEAGADLFLMPSQYEPCGLNQIYSLKYGTVPVVRATGGLDDTIEVGTGFKFAEYSAQAFLRAIDDAVAAYADRDGWQTMMRRGMGKDFSWRTSAAEYSALYRRLLAPVNPFVRSVF
jgi:starch synthase